MTARPALVVVLLAASGAAMFVLAGDHAPASRYGAAGIGALAALLATAWLLRELRRRDRFAIAIGAGALGFFVAAVSGVGPFPGALAFAAAFLPAWLLFMAGIGRERLAFELERLEAACDDPAARPGVIARATSIRDEAREAARAIDPDARETPLHPGDPRAVHAYAAQVLAYTRALDGAHAEAIAALGEVPLAWMPKGMRPLMIGNLAFWSLCAGDPAAALAEVDRLAEKDAPGELRPPLRAARAAALAQLDRADEALAIVGRSEEDAPSPSLFQPRFHVVRAHALAALGEMEMARAEVALAASTADGRAELSRWRAARGPAIALIDEALAA